MSRSLDAERKAYRECVRIIRLLVKLDKEYTNLKVLAVKDSTSFDKNIIHFSRALSRAERKIKEYILKYEVYGTPIFEFDQDSTLKPGFKGLLGREIKTVKPINLHPTLLKSLMKGMPRTSKIDDLINRRIRVQPDRKESNLLSPRQASDILGVSYKTLWRWWKEGRIQAVRLPSRRLRYPREEVERILKTKHKNPDQL